MKRIKILLYVVVTSLLFVSCDRDFQAPPINVPTFDRAANTDISKLKEFYSKIKDPTVIDVDFVLRGYVTADDRAGNIYKQIFIQDGAGALSIGVDQNSIFNTFGVGQEVVVELKGLSVLKYGDELQIGYSGTNANRIPWEIAKKSIHRDGWPDPLKVQPKLVKIGELSDDMVNKLVRLDQIYFVNGGKVKFTTDDKTTDEMIKDLSGKSIAVRTSSFASFAKEDLPKGIGSLTGILGRYRGSWQLIVRDKEDIGKFGGEIPSDPVEPDPVTAILQETFGNEDVTSKPKVADYKGFDSKSPIMFSDPSGRADIRATKAFNNHVWMPKGDVGIVISGINTLGKENLHLSYDVTGNIFNDGDSMNINALKVNMNGVELSLPNFVLTKADGYGNRYYTVTIDVSKIPKGESITLKFHTDANLNLLGMRLDNVRLFTK